MDLCNRHYARANRSGLMKPDIEALSPEELLARFGTWDALSTGNRTGKPVATAPVPEPLPEAAGAPSCSMCSSQIFKGEACPTCTGAGLHRCGQPTKGGGTCLNITKAPTCKIHEDTTLFTYEQLEKSNIEMGKRNEDIESANASLRLDRKTLQAVVERLQQENKSLQASHDSVRHENSLFSVALDKAQDESKKLKADIDELLGKPAGAIGIPSLNHGELSISCVDLDASSKLRVILRGDGCRDVAHLVGRKIRLSRLSEG